jgi:hypothetical protein
MKDQTKLDAEQSSSDSDRMRVPYARPELKVFGSIVELTHAVGNKGNVTDGGSMGKTKTS